MKNFILFGGLLFLALNTSCVAVKPYEKVYLNDEDMALGIPRFKKFETTFQLYREGGSGANGGKTGGGCGCN